jgi:hypothetical protein
MPIPLESEFKYYLDHQDELVQRYNGRVVVIKDLRVIGDYPDVASAVFETQKVHELGTFLVQTVTPGTEAYTQTFHSRVRIQRTA